jgi:cyanate lyase
MNRQLLTEKIVTQKRIEGISWKEIAAAIGRSPGFATAALLGQLSLSKDEAEKTGNLLGLTEDEIALLQQVMSRGSLPTTVPVDPLIFISTRSLRFSALRSKHLSRRISATAS